MLAFMTERGINLPPEFQSCIPNGVSNEQVQDVTVRYLRQHPETRDFPARALTMNAPALAWPCGRRRA
jgi:hypothetical protein